MLTFFEVPNMVDATQLVWVGVGEGMITFIAFGLMLDATQRVS